MLYEKLISLGFSRIGFACPRAIDDRVNNRWSGAYLSMQMRYANQKRLEPFLDAEIQGSRDEFLVWYETTKPDVIITGGEKNYYNFLLEAGISVPRNVQVVSIHAEGEDNPQAGIKQNAELVGTASVDQLVAVIHRFTHGLEPYPKTVTVRGEWKDGKSFDEGLAPGRKPEGK
jgi:DNA-binding LacI/PurR family transcriptional regulator